MTSLADIERQIEEGRAAWHAISNRGTCGDSGKPQGDGLVMHERDIDGVRKIREFELLPGRTKRDTWMAPFLAPSYKQLRINNGSQSPEECATFISDYIARCGYPRKG